MLAESVSAVSAEPALKNISIFEMAQPIFVEYLRLALGAAEFLRAVVVFCQNKIIYVRTELVSSVLPCPFQELVSQGLKMFDLSQPAFVFYC